MDDILEFQSREDFRQWLRDNCLTSPGVWLLFGKAGGPKTLKASEALEEALCFGWIDGKMQSIDAKCYKKYFALRRKNSNWSDKNKALVATLIERGVMTDFGLEKINEAKQNGQWDAIKPPSVTEEHVEQLGELLKGHEPAYTNFVAMSPSVKRTYARGYFDAKTQAGQTKRLAWIIERLDQNLKPM